MRRAVRRVVDEEAVIARLRESPGVWILGTAIQYDLGWSWGRFRRTVGRLAVQGRIDARTGQDQWHELPHLRRTMYREIGT